MASGKLLHAHHHNHTCLIMNPINDRTARCASGTHSYTPVSQHATMSSDLIDSGELSPSHIGNF